MSLLSPEVTILALDPSTDVTGAALLRFDAKHGIARILAGVEPRPGALQSVVSERREEIERAAAARTVTSPKTKREINPDWLPDVAEAEARELLNDAVKRLPPGRPDGELVHLARKLWRTVHPDALPAVWEPQGKKRVAAAESKPEDEATIRAEHQRKMEMLRAQSETSEASENENIVEPQTEPQADNVRDILAAQFAPQEGLK